MVQIWVWKCKVTTSNLICCERFSRLEYHWFILNNYFKDLFFIKPSSDYFFCWSNPQPEIVVLTPTWFDEHSLCMRAAEPQSCWFPDCIAGECLWEYHRARAGNRPRFGNYTLAHSLKRCILSLLSPSERFFLSCEVSQIITVEIKGAFIDFLLWKLPICELYVLLLIDL